jgi:tetratricopeptide (TPR) repeat protein
MGLFGRRLAYDRKRILAEAERARGKGRSRRAIFLYRQVLAAEPNNAELHARIAPLLAKSGEAFDAWQSYRHAAQALVEAKKTEDALRLYRDACERLPRRIETWLAAAQLERSRGRHNEAKKLLLAGRARMRARGRRPEAIALLKSVREIEPWEPEVVLDLARLLAKSRQQPEATSLLEQLAERGSGSLARRVRGVLWRMHPSLRNTWAWLRAGSVGGADAKAARAAAARR